MSGLISALTFGERALLERDEEIALAKQLDLGTRQIRQTLQQAVKAGGRLKRTDRTAECLETLKTVRRLSGLSATVLNLSLIHISEPTRPY